MEFKEVIYAKAAMEREITYFIQDKIKEFQEKTGVAIDNMKLDIGPIEQTGSEPRKGLLRFRAIIIL